jgi:hypothetical protein
VTTNAHRNDGQHGEFCSLSNSTSDSVRCEVVGRKRAMWAMLLIATHARVYD